MQRESQLTQEAERKLTEELANNIGKALEDISMAAGSVAHLYKSLDMGARGTDAKVNAKDWNPSFSKMIEEVGSIQVSATSQQSTEVNESMDDEPLDQLMSIMQKEDFIKVLMNKT